MPLPYYMVAVVRILWPFMQTFSKCSSPELVRQKGILWVKLQVLAWIASNFCCISTVHFRSGFLVSSDPIVLKLLIRLYILSFLEMMGLKIGTENFCHIFQPTRNIWNTAALKSDSVISAVNLTQGILLHECMMETTRVPTTDALVVDQVLTLTAEVTLLFENSARKLTRPRN